MTDYLSRAEILRVFGNLTVKNPDDKYQHGMQDAIECLIPEVINGMEAADVQTVEHSKWICVNEDENVYMCDKCGGEVIFIEGNPTNNEYIYCMYCGAKMDMPEAIKG